MIQTKSLVLSAILVGIMLGSGCAGLVGTDMSGSESGTAPTAQEGKASSERATTAPAARPTESSSSELPIPKLTEADKKVRANRERITEIMRENREMRMPSSLTNAEKKVTVRQKYSLGSIASAVVGSGESLLLECAPNPFHIHQLVIYPSGENRFIYAYVVFQYNSFDVRREDRTTTKSLDFSPRQNPAVVLYVEWRASGKGIDLRVQAKGNQGFGKAVAAELETIRGQLLTTVQPGPPNESPQDRRERLNEMTQKRLVYEGEMKKRIEALKVEYKMGSDL